MAAIDESKARRGGHATDDPGDDAPTVLMALPLMPPQLKRAPAPPPVLRKAPSLPPLLTTAPSQPPPPTKASSLPPPLKKGHVLPPPQSGIYTKGEPTEPVVIPPNPVPVIEPVVDADAEVLGFVEAEDDDARNAKADRADHGRVDWGRTSNDRVDLEAVLHRVSLSSAPPPPGLAANAVPPPPPVRFAPLDATFDLLAPRPSAPPPATLSWPVLAGSALLLVSVGVAISPFAHHFLSSRRSAASPGSSASAPREPEVAPEVPTSAAVAAGPIPSPSSTSVDSSAPAPAAPAVAAVVPTAALPTPLRSNVAAAGARFASDSARLAAVAAAAAPVAAPASSPEAASETPAPSADEAPAAPASAAETATASSSAEAPSAEPAAPAAEPAAPPVRDVDHLLAGAVASTDGAAITSLAGGSPAARVSVPAQPSRPEVLAAMRTVHSRVRACSVSTGPAILRVTFGSDGTVTSAVATGALAGTAEGQCMAEAVRSARVSPFSRPSFSIDYPFTR